MLLSEDALRELIKDSHDTDFSLDIEQQIINDLEAYNQYSIKRAFVVGITLLALAIFLCASAFTVFIEIDEQIISACIAGISIFLLFYLLNEVQSLPAIWMTARNHLSY